MATRATQLQILLKRKQSSAIRLGLAGAIAILQQGNRR